MHCEWRILAAGGSLVMPGHLTVHLISAASQLHLSISTPRVATPLPSYAVYTSYLSFAAH